MLVIDENKLKLLKMKEKLLEISGNDDVILSQYRDIILDIDNEMYNTLVDMVKNTNCHNLPLEEQLKLLTNLENEYVSFYEFQCRYRNIYDKYASDKLILSPIDDIEIDKIRERISAINGYLVNNENLLKYRNSLDGFNVELIAAEKKKATISSKFMSLEKTLKNNVLNAEGRLYKDANLEYISIIKEFSLIGLDLSKILEDSDLLKKELILVDDLLLSEQEKMNAARICFNSMPNGDTREMYDTSLIGVLKARYKMTLLKIVDLIANEFTDYNEIKSKRLQLLDLVKKRVQYLEQLGINLLIDPFDRIKINEQLEIIDLLGNSMYDIALIKEKIKDTCDIVENIKNKNNELFMIISQDVEFFNDKKSISNMVQEFNIEAVPVDFTLDAIHQSDDVVVDIKEIPDSLNINLVRKKTGGVITRVYELFTNVAVETVKESVVPQLVIERDSTFEKNDSQEEVIENEPLFDDNLSAAMDSFNENTLEKMESLDNASESVKSQLVVAADNNSEKRDSQKVVIENEPLFDDNLSATMDSFNENLFEEVEPFEKVALFTSKSDDIFLGNNNQNEDNDIMPELLFDDEEKNLYDDTLENDNSNVLSFDEQIEKLMADSSKIKKLTA